MKDAFTLAEVLLTLGIIGVVAALTMTALIENYQKKETEAKVKKAYSAIGQYLQKAEADNGSFCNWAINSVGSSTDNRFQSYVIPYFEVIDSSLSGNATNFLDKIGYNRDTLDNGSYTAFKTLDGNAYSDYWSDNYFLTKDGMLYGFGMHQNQAWYNCVWQVFVDINGPKKPNIAGKDLFLFEIRGYPENTRVTGISSSGGCNGIKCKQVYDATPEKCKQYGHYCINKIIQNGWKITKDYPW